MSVLRALYVCGSTLEYRVMPRAKATGLFAVAFCFTYLEVREGDGYFQQSQNVVSERD